MYGNQTIETFFDSYKIPYHAARMERGDQYYLVRRSDALRVFEYCRKQYPGDVSSLRKQNKRIVFGRDDYDFISGPGIRLDGSGCIVLFCTVSRDGRWITRYAHSPISRIMPPTNRGGVFQDGLFLTEQSIAFKPENSTLNLHEGKFSGGPRDIDIVYTWVDSSDPRWMIKKSIFSEKNTFLSADNAYRYISRDELKYSIRSVEKFAPWVRNIYVVTDEQKPEWLRENDKVKVIDHREIFPDKSVLPVFNSHSIEACLHRIEGLSEFFIYFNDDVFLGGPVSPSDFFDKKGRSLVYISQASFIDPTIPSEMQVPTDVAAYNMQNLIKRDFGFVPTRKMMHTPHPLRKSLMLEICDVYAEEVEVTRKARVRSASDLAIPSMFYPYYAWATGRAVLRIPGSTRYRYFDTGKSDVEAAVAAILQEKPNFFCANVTYHEEVDIAKQAKLLADMFEKMYPEKSTAEV